MNYNENTGLYNDFYLFVQYVLLILGAFKCIDLIILEKSAKILFFECFLISFSISLFLLNYSWSPFLNPNINANWGFDPQRYYYYITQIIKYEDYDFGLNYKGVVYFFLFVMRLFGCNPLVPLFINEILFLLSVLSIVKLFSYDKTVNIKYFACLFFIPEIVAYVIMPSREILCMSFISIGISSIFLFLKTNAVKYLIVFSACMLLLTYIRLPFAIMTFICVGIHLMITRGRKQIILFALPAFLVILVGTYFSNIIGSDVSFDNLFDKFSTSVNGSVEFNSNLEYGTNSLALMLIPHNPIEYILFGGIRSFAYLLPPFDLMSIFSEFATYSFVNKLVDLTSAMTVITMPLVYLGVKYNIRNKKEISIICISFLLLWIFIGVSGTQMIHVRYRISYIVLYFVILLYAINKISFHSMKLAVLKWVYFLICITFLFVMFKYDIL